MRDPRKVILFDSRRTWTWSELLWRAQQYADAMKDAAPDRRNTPVMPILVDRTGETVAAILGALMTGRGFAPLSAQQPLFRLAHCLSALDARLIVGPSDATYWDEKSGPAPMLIQPSRRAADDIVPPCPEDLDRDQILYVLFTSGSTGVPKGVMADCGNIENTMLWSQDMLDWRPGDVIGCCTNFFFDISMFDVFTSLNFDVPLAIYSSPFDVSQVVAETARFDVTSVFGVPAFFSQLLRQGALADPALKSLRRIISGGDFFPPSHVLEWLRERPQVEIYNVWGPTETSIVNTMHKVGPNDVPELQQARPAPVGKEHPRMRFCLIDSSGDVIQGLNQRGEICMLGVCVTRGYLKDPELTANAYVEINGERAFRTQDLGYLDDNRNLHVIGRTGGTVKIAGYRVDLGEVEAAATSIPDIHAASSFVREPESSEGYPELWLAIEMEQRTARADIFGIKKRLRAALPSYMVPKRIIVFLELPRNANGKIDRKAVAQRAVAEAMPS